jgi:histidyl-tRNA synthetase
LPEIEQTITVYVATVNETDRAEAVRIMTGLRRGGLNADMDFMERSLKNQLTQANRLKARFTVIIGETETAQGKVTLKNMLTGEQELLDAGQLLPKIKAEMEE